MKFSITFKVILIICAVVTLGGCLNNPKRNRYLIPQDYAGTVYIYYNVQEAESLMMEDGFRLIVIPESGIKRTSSEPIGGKLYDEYWLYSGNKRTIMSPYKLGGGGTVQRLNSLGQPEIFFQFEVLKEERPHETLWSIFTRW